jgi:hypothetical protein
MAEQQVHPWPRFTLVTYTAPTGIPQEWDAELLEKGAPDGLACTAARDLTFLTQPDAGPLVCFGMTGPDAYFCLDPHTKQVVGVNDGAFRHGDSQPQFAGPAWFVNSSLDQFIASVRAITARFPYDAVSLKVSKRLSIDEWDLSDDDWDELFREHNQAADDLTEMLGRIDPAAVVDQDGFWMGFVADVQMGNYATRYFLRPPER